MYTLSRAPTSLRDRALVVAVVVCVWTLFGILSSAHFFLGEEARSGRASLGDIAGHVLIFYWAWAALTPLALLALRTVTDPEMPAARRWWNGVGAAIALIAMHGIIYLIAVRLAGVEVMSAIGVPEIGDYAMRHAGGDAATVGVIAAVYLVLDARQRAHDREIATAALRARLSLAELELLRFQLQPHFLHNALNTLSTLVLRGDAPRADEAIGHIARYLRSALAQRADSLVTVHDEVRSVLQYFAIEQLRFDDLVCLDVQVAPEAEQLRIPALILQPLIENAIRHGRSTAGGAHIAVLVSVLANRIAIRVTDSGRDADIVAGDPPGSGDGFGLRYIRERLEHFYGANAWLQLRVAADGAEVIVSLPLVATAVARYA